MFVFLFVVGWFCWIVSIFVEFDTKENAAKAVEQSEKYEHGGETISVSAVSSVDASSQDFVKPFGSIIMPGVKYALRLFCGCPRMKCIAVRTDILC